MTYDLVAIGSITKDVFIISDRGKIFKTPKDKLAPEWLGFELGEKICIEKIIANIGGVATNVAIGAKKMGLNSVPLGMIGKDAEGEWILSMIKKEKVSSELIKAAVGRKSPVSTLIVDKKTGERVIFFEKSSGEIDLANFSKVKTKSLFVSSLTGNCSKQIGIFLDYAKKYSVRLIASPGTSQIIDDWKNLKRLLEKSEIIFLNRNEAIEIAVREKESGTSIKSLTKFLHKLGPKIVCITDGIHGANCSDGKKIYYAPIKKVKTVEMTGAGDAFAAGFLGFFLKGSDLKTSLRAGIINSASVVRHVGTTKGLLTKKDILSKMK
jgi:pseudouridine kinase